MRKALALLPCLCLVVGSVPGVTSGAHSETRAAPGPRPATAKAEQARARQRAAVLDAEARSATLAGERAILAAAALAGRVQQAEASVAAAEAALAAIRRKQEALRRRLARERAPVARLLAGLQTQLRRPPLLALLQPGALEDAVHLRAVLAAVEPQIAARTAGLRALAARSATLERAAAEAARGQRARQAALVHRRAELAALSAAERLKARRAAGAADREAERAQAIGQQTRSLSTLVRRVGIADVSRSRSPGRADAGAPTPYRLPVDAASSGGDASADGALMLAARPGALVVAPAAGTIAFAGPFRGFGTIVIVDHGRGWTSVVTGLSRAQVAIGQPVVAGSPLGVVPRDDPKIGLELRRDGRRVDPMDQLRR